MGSWLVLWLWFSAKLFGDFLRGAKSESRNGKCGIGAADGRKDGRANDEDVAMVVCAGLRIHNGLFGIVPHAAGAHDVAGAVKGFGVRPEIDFGGPDETEHVAQSFCGLRKSVE